MKKSENTIQKTSTISVDETSPVKNKRKRRPLLTHLLVAFSSFAIALSLSWHLQPKILKQQEERAKWQTLLWLAKLPSDRREELFQEAISIDEQATAAAKTATGGQKESPK